MRKKRAAKSNNPLLIILGLIVFATIVLPLLGLAWSMVWRGFNSSTSSGNYLNIEDISGDPSISDEPVYEDRDYNCSDFRTHIEAQRFFESAGAEDRHKLDKDGNGLACESLP